MLGLVGNTNAQLFWLLILIVLYVFYVIKNCLALNGTEEKGKLMNKNATIWVLSFFDAASTAIMGFVVNAASGSTPLT